MISIRLVGMIRICSPFYGSPLTSWNDNLSIVQCTQSDRYQSGGGKGIGWKSFEHNGVYFPELPEKLPTSARVKIKGKYMDFSPEIEEYLVAFVRFLKGEQGENRTAHANFIEDFNYFTKLKLQSIDDIDFKPLEDHLELEKELKNNKSKDEKQEVKLKHDEMLAKYRTVSIDGNPEPNGNFVMEAAGIFRGRGAHPFVGKIKRRVLPSEVTLNLSKKALVPKPNIGGTWDSIVNEPSLMWIASWKDPLTGKVKYVYPSVNSSVRGSNDMAKYDTARKLKKYIGRIRRTYLSDIESTDVKTRQLAIALYFIDMFALRVGNEKGENTADTVGVTQLRFEHIQFDKNSSTPNRIKLHFLGKDSVPYKRTIDVLPKVWAILHTAHATSKRTAEIFDHITSRELNEYLESFGVKKLTAKVFRTYHASTLLQSHLDKFTKVKPMAESGDDKDKEPKARVKDSKSDAKIAKKIEQGALEYYNDALREVAKLCNHQKQVAKSHDASVDKLKERIKELQSLEKDIRDAINTSNATLTKAQEKTQKNKEDKLKERMSVLRKKIKTKDKLKNFSLGTSKMNYLDPRITFAFSKRVNVSVEKFFNKTLLERFQWATDTPHDFTF